MASKLSAVLAALALSFGTLTATPAHAELPACTIVVDQSGVTVDGTEFADVICLNADNVTVNALGGDDTVIDNGVDNIVNLGEGFDIFDGTNGDGSTVDGGPGDDELTGTPGEDELDGGDGDDSLVGGLSNDTLNGGLGADQLTGSAGDDILAGGDGLDALSGGAGLNMCDYDSGEVLTESCTYDDAGPTYTDVSFTPESLEVGENNASIRVQVTFSDVSGVAYLTLGCGKYGPTSVSVSVFRSQSEWVVSRYDANGSGQASPIPVVDPKRFVLAESLVLAKGSQPGIYSCFIFATDSLSNNSTLNPTPNFTVTRSTGEYDDAGPEISGLSFSESSVEVGSSAAKLKLQFAVSDPSSINSGQLLCSGSKSSYEVDFYFHHGIWHAFELSGIWSTDFDTSNAVDAKKFIFDEEITIPLGTYPGILSCDFSGSDILGNSSKQVGIGNLIVNRTGGTFDDDGPALKDISFVPSVVEVGASAAKARLKFTVSDQTGIRSLFLSCAILQSGFTVGIYRGDSGWIAYQTDLARTSYFELPTPTDYKSVEFDQDIDLPFGFDPGMYQCSYSATDELSHFIAENSVASLSVLRTPPGLPSGPKMKAFNPNGPNGGVLTWDAPESLGSPALVGYVVQYSEDGKAWLELPSGSTSSTSLTISGLVADKDYWFRVRGENGGTLNQDTSFMNLAWSEFFVHTLSAQTPSAPTGLQSTQVTETTLTLGWSLPTSNGGAPITDYKVEVSSNCSTYTVLSHPASNNLAFDVTGLNAGTRYCFKVSAINSAGASPTSEVLTLTTVGNPPAAPTSLSVKASKTSVVLGWKKPTSVGSGAIRNFIVEYSKDGGNTWITVKKSVSTSTKLTITGLKSKRSYKFRVTAVNDVGNSPTSKSLNVKTP